MNLNEQIRKSEQRAARLESSYAMNQIKKRKKETRHKIQMGGLVVKALMDQYSTDVILGALLDAKEQIGNSEDVKRIYQLKGQDAFMTTENERR